MIPFRTGLGEKVDRLICQRTALSNASIPDSPILFPEDRKKTKCIVFKNIFKQLIQVTETMTTGTIQKKKKKRALNAPYL